MKLVDLRRIIKEEKGHILVLTPGFGKDDGFWVKVQAVEIVLVEEVSPGQYIVDTSKREIWELENPKHAVIIC